MMQTLTLHDVVDACITGLKEDRLGAPHVSEETPMDCLYIYPDGRRCAIGMALNDETIKVLVADERLSMGLFALLDNYIEFHGSEAEKEMLYDIQSAHDAWVGKGDDPGYRAAFMDTLESATALIGAEGTA